MLNTLLHKLTAILIAGIVSLPALGKVSCEDLSMERESVQQRYSAASDTTTVFFRVSYVLPDRQFRNNGIRIDSLMVFVDSLKNAGNISIKKILFIAGASPEGRANDNKVLAQKRADHMASLVISRFPDLKPVVETLPLGEDWEGTIKMLEMAGNIPYKEEALDIMRNVPLHVIKGGKVVDTRKRRLMNLNYGRTWNAMLADFFPDLRRTRIIMECEVKLPEALPVPPEIPEEPLEEKEISVDMPEHKPITDTVTKPVLPIIPIVPIEQEDVDVEEGKDTVDISDIKVEPIERYARRTIIAAKTNLLYDAVTALNFEIEVPIGKRFSLAVEDVFPWWTWGPHDRKYAFQMWEVGVEPRWWFNRTDSRDVLSGHFAGVYGMVSKYDFQWDYDLCYQGEYLSVGLTYGYAMKLGRLFNLEFSLSAGYLESDYRHYVPSPGYEHLYRDRYKTGKISYFGPTKVKVALVLP